MKYLFLFVSTFLITQCKTVQFDTHPPFKITKAIYKNWSGGQPGVSGTNVFINYTSENTIVFDSIYFKNKVTKIAFIKSENSKQIAGYFNTSTRKNEDIILHQNATKELKNKIPKTKKIPFELKQTEAVISYKEKGKTNYFKVTLEKEKSDFYQ